MKTIVVIHDEPLTKKIKRNFFIDELMVRGFHVEYWSVHKLLFKKLDLVDGVKESFCIDIISYAQLKELIIKFENSFYIVDFLITRKSYWILYYLAKHHCLISAFGIHTSINLSLKEKFLNIQNYGLAKIFPFAKSVIDKIVVRFMHYFFPISDLDVFFFCGNKSFSFLNAKKKVAINSFDYEDYRKLLSETSFTNLENRRYAVFLDQFLPYHPDIKLCWGKQNVSPAKYYSVLNDFFSKVEQKYSLEVIIAAHPKADYNTDVFGGRKILKYQTAKLVMYSQLVIAHSSLSISFSVLNYKPLVLVYLTDFYKMGTSTMVLIKKMSKELGSISICLDKDYTLEDLKIPDFVKYDNYKYNYLTSHKSECLENVDIIYSVVNDL